MSEESYGEICYLAWNEEGKNIPRWENAADAVITEYERRNVALCTARAHFTPKLPSVEEIARTTCDALPGRKWNVLTCSENRFDQSYVTDTRLAAQAVLDLL